MQFAGKGSDDSIVGTAQDDLIAGKGGHDRLEGLGGADTLDGGNGDDTLVGGAGDDVLYLGGGENDIAYGGDGDDVIYYDAVGASAILFGGTGYDRVDTSLFNHDTTISLRGDIEAFHGGSGADLVSSTEGDALGRMLDGGAGDDVLEAVGDIDDILIGGEGDDILDGFWGNDRLDGGAGWDIADFSSSENYFSGVTVSLRLQDRWQVISEDGRVVRLSGIENLWGSNLDDVLTGDKSNNWLRGLAGGNDLLSGGAGDDFIDSNGFVDDSTTVNGGRGQDTFFLLPNHPEYHRALDLSLEEDGAQVFGPALLTLLGIENLSGSALADHLVGNGGANLLAGGEGADALLGEAGADRLYGDGEFTPYGLVENVELRAGADTLEGGAGRDSLIGGVGADVLTGGDGGDAFVYLSLADSGSDSSESDRITDLGRGDVIDLSAIDAVSDTPRDEAFHIVTAFTGAGQAVMSYDEDAGLTWLLLETNGDGVADAAIAIDGDHTAFTGFIL